MAGRVVIVLLDNGATAITVPQNSTQLVIGTSSDGTVAAPYASTSPQNLVTQFGYGPLVEAAAMIAAVGGVPVCVKATSATAGASGAVTPGASNTGTSVMTFSVGAAFDTYMILVTCVVAGTVGTGPVGITISLDAGRTTSAQINLGTATTYAIPNTGLTLSFTAAAMALGDTYTAGTTEPLWNDSGIQAAINAFLASSYGKQGVGSVHIVGGSTAVSGASGATGADMVAIGGYLQTARTNQYVFMHAYISARDAKHPVAYSGATETESSWMTAIETDFQGQSLNADTTGRTSVCAAYWNMQSQLTNGLGLSPRFRRSVAFAVAQRDVQIPPQRMPSRVKDGALSPIVITPADKTDGFVYHDESITPGLDSTTGGSGGYFATTTSIAGLSGIFLQHANLFSPVGSSYGYMPQGHVIDIFASIVYQIGIQEIDDDVRIQSTGGIDPRDAQTISDAIGNAVQANMTNQGMLVASAANPTGCLVAIDTTAPLGPGSPGNLPIQAQAFGKGYILKETISIGFAPAGAT